MEASRANLKWLWHNCRDSRYHARISAQTKKLSKIGRASLTLPTYGIVVDEIDDSISSSTDGRWQNDLKTKRDVRQEVRETPAQIPQRASAQAARSRCGSSRSATLAQRARPATRGTQSSRFLTDSAGGARARPRPSIFKRCVESRDGR